MDPYMTSGDSSMPQAGAMAGMDPRQLQAMMAMAGSAARMPGAAGAMPGQDPAAGMDPSVALSYMQMLQTFMAQQQGLPNMPLGGPYPGAPYPGAPFPGAPFPGAPYGAPAAQDPSFTVSVENMKFQYQLTEDDLMKVFTRYGSVKQIQVDEASSSATVSFFNLTEAQAAMSDLNGKVLNGLDGTLLLNWVNKPSLPPPYPGMFPGWGMGMPPPWMTPGAPPGPGAPQAVPSPLPTTSSTCAGGDGRAAHVKGVRKYTCRFLLGIENDKEFQVARRIIGAKGANMKRIVRQTEAKIRLRGQGSGYFEGAGQKESSEPLQLCVSCTDAEAYKTAVRQVEELLKRVYEEYAQFCRDTNKPVPDLQINLSENQLVYSSRTSPGGIGGVPGADGDSPSYGGAGKSGGNKSDRARRPRARGKEGAGGEADRGEPGPNAPPQEEIERMVDQRNEARRACNFAEADRIREVLHGSGVALMDEPGGRGLGAEVTTWRYWRD